MNVAAIANIDFAEKNKSLAYAVNVIGAENCALAAKEIRSKYIWFSSDAVFSGDENCYDENSVTNPKNYYGETKLLGENRIIKANPDAIILRLSLILGVSANRGNSTFSQILTQLKAGEITKASTIEIRTPIYVGTLCDAIFELFSKNYKGILNLGSTSSASRYDIAKRIAVCEGYPESLIEPINGADPKKAPRHVNGIIDVSKALSVLSETRLYTWQETVDLALKNKEEK